MNIAGRFKTVCVAVIGFFVVFSLFVLQTLSGTLDPTFGTGGKVTTDFPFTSSSSYSSYGYNIFVQPLGRIVGVGAHYQPGPDGLMPGVAAVGLTPTGVVDPAFSGGKTLEWTSFAFTGINDARMLPDGRILWLSQYLALGGTHTLLLRRINVDGSTDATFNPDLRIDGATPYPGRIGVLSNGKILVLVQTGNHRFYLIRLNADGTRDPSFGTKGEKELTRLGNRDETFETLMEILPNGKILIGGGNGFASGTGDFNELYIARMDPNGNMDHSFGRLGLVTHTFGQRVYPTDLLVQPDGKYLISGVMTDSNPSRDAFMARFTQRGRLDGSFGSGGKVVTDFFSFGDDYFNSVALTSDGKIIAAGRSPLPPSAFSNFLLARYSANGTLEAQTFTPFTPSANSEAQDVMILADGKILVIGFTKNPNPSVSGNVFAIARYTAITND